MLMMRWLLRVWTVAGVVGGVSGFAAWMVSEHCQRPVQPGEIIMNHPAELSDQRRVQVYKRMDSEEVELVSGRGVFFPGEELRVSVSGSPGENTGTQFLFETKGGQFLQETGHGCGRTRTSSSTAVLTMPHYEVEVAIWVGWASSYGVVTVSPKFTLIPASSSDLNRSNQSAIWQAKPLEHVETAVEIDVAEEEWFSGNLRGKGEEEYDVLWDRSGPLLIVLGIVLVGVIFKRMATLIFRLGGGKKQ